MKGERGGEMNQCRGGTHTIYYAFGDAPPPPRLVYGVLGVPSSLCPSSFQKLTDGMQAWRGARSQGEKLLKRARTKRIRYA